MREFGDEIAAIKGAGFHVIHRLADISRNDYIIPRFFWMPFVKEVYEEIGLHGGESCQTPAHHGYLADIGVWYPDMMGVTPESWPSVLEIPSKEEGPFVVKGHTNSLRHLWRTHMHAPTRADLGRVISNLQNDTSMWSQRPWIRKYEDLRILTTDVVGRPIPDEYRVFVFDGQLVSQGFYWTNMLEGLERKPLGSVPEEFIRYVIERVGDSAMFWSADIALREDGSPVLIELNDGCMSGLNGYDPCKFWTQMAEITSGRLLRYTNPNPD